MYAMKKVGVGHHLARADGWAIAHRLVAEEKIGRRLVEGEVVHHIDGDKLNNAPENLRVFDNSGEHTRFHAIERFPKTEIFVEIIARGMSATNSTYQELADACSPPVTKQCISKMVASKQRLSEDWVFRLVSAISEIVRKREEVYSEFEAEFGVD